MYFSVNIKQSAKKKKKKKTKKKKTNGNTNKKHNRLVSASDFNKVRLSVISQISRV